MTLWTHGLYSLYDLKVVLYHRVDTAGVPVIFIEVITASEDIFYTA